MIKTHDHDLAEWRFGSGHRQKNTTTTTTNKSRAEQEPRSAHGRAVKKRVHAAVRIRTNAILGNPGLQRGREGKDKDWEREKRRRRGGEGKGKRKGEALGSFSRQTIS